MLPVSHADTPFNGHADPDDAVTEMFRLRDSIAVIGVDAARCDLELDEEGSQVREWSAPRRAELPAVEAMLLIVGTFRLPPEQLIPARAAMARMIEASRSEDGCHAYVYAEDVLEPGLVHVKELWRDQAALDRHFATHHLAAWRAAWQRLQISDRDLRLYEVGEPRPT
jgi:quinol monooxygenase YgiN